MNIRLQRCPNCKAYIHAPGKILQYLDKHPSVVITQKDLGKKTGVKSIRQVQKATDLLRTRGEVVWLRIGKVGLWYVRTTSKRHQAKTRKQMIKAALHIGANRR